MDKDKIEYLRNYKPNELYIHETEKGKYVTIVKEEEESFGEIQVSPRIKLAIKGFYVKDKSDITSYELINGRSGAPRFFCVNLRKIVSQMLIYLYVNSAFRANFSQIYPKKYCAAKCPLYAGCFSG